MQSRRIRQSPGHKTDRQTIEGLGENQRKLILVPGARLETAKNKKQTNNLHLFRGFPSQISQYYHYFGKLGGSKKILSCDTEL